MEQTIIGLDPGGTTGVCIYKSNGHTLTRLQLDGGNHHNDLWNLLGHHAPHIVVCERFDYRPNQKHAELISVEYIGVVRLWCRRTNTPLIEQRQLKGRQGLWSDAKLKKLDVYIPGNEHAMDATRQVLYYLTVELNDMHWVNQYKRVIDGDA